LSSKNQFEVLNVGNAAISDRYAERYNLKLAFSHDASEFDCKAAMVLLPQAMTLLRHEPGVRVDFRDMITPNRCELDA